MAPYSKFAEGYFTATAATAKTVTLPFVPNTFEIWNKTQWGSNSATSQIQYAIGYSEDTAGYGYSQQNVASQVYMKNIAHTTGAFTFFSAGQPALGPAVALTSTYITQASPALVTSTSHGLVTGDVVYLYATTTMLQVGGIPYTVTKVDANTFTINVVSSGFAAAATAGYFKKVLYPNLYLPGARYITAITTGTTTLIGVSQNHNMVVGQQVQFSIPSQWGMTQLDGLKGYITAVASSTLTVAINSTSFTAFAYPTSATAGLGVSFPQVIPIGDSNTGYSGPTVPQPQTIPGAYVANTSSGVIVGASLLLNTSDVIRWRATYPDMILTS